MITIFILIYLISFIIHLLLEYKENKRYIIYIGDLIDNIRFYMWFPIINTFIILIFIIGYIIITLQKLLKLDILWEKFRNIRLR